MGGQRAVGQDTGLADHLPRPHASGFDRRTVTVQRDRHHTGLDDEQVIADLPCIQDRLAGAEGLQGHVLAEGVFLFLAQGGEQRRAIEQRPWPREVARRTGFDARQQVDPGGPQMSVRQVEQLIAYRALFAHRGDKAADFVFVAGSIGAFERDFGAG
ncbi:hypothetical protein D3C84_709480 [compost metagenome]